MILCNIVNWEIMVLSKRQECFEKFPFSADRGIRPLKHSKIKFRNEDSLLLELFSWSS